jgi:hypothetical protein
MEPILSQPAEYIISPLVTLDEQRLYPGSIIFLDKPGMVQLIREARDWYEPIEDEL